MATQVATDFLQSLKYDDMVLVCQDDGEVYCSAKVWGTGGKVIRISAKELRYNEGTFSRKTGKQHGGDLFLQPYDEARYQAHVADMAKLHEEIEQRQKARDTERRDGLKTAILSVADMIDDANLDRLSTSDLQSLMAILNKLGGE